MPNVTNLTNGVADRSHRLTRPSRLCCVTDQQQAAFPWPPASATGVGSMPGTDPAEALRVVLGELPDLPFLPELPARGPGADMIGRTAALLVDMPVETAPSGWRLTTAGGRDLRRARGFLAHDLDALEETAVGYQGPFKISVCGPWTLAATIELASHHPALADPGATRDLTRSLAEGVAAHVAEIAKRLPGARILAPARRACAARRARRSRADRQRLGPAATRRRAGRAGRDPWRARRGAGVVRDNALLRLTGAPAAAARRGGRARCVLRPQPAAAGRGGRGRGTGRGGR